MTNFSALDLAKLFHETYEELAPYYRYETRQETREFNPDSPNGRLMVAVSEKVLKHIGEKIQKTVCEALEKSITAVEAGKF